MCGAIGHTANQCRFLSPAIDFDEAGRQALAKIGQVNRRSAPRPSARGCAAIKRAGTFSHENTAADTDKHGHVAPLPVIDLAPLNILWKSEQGDGAVYVGGMQAASSHSLLAEHGITHVVNCMNRPSLNVEPGVEYFDFPIEKYHSHCPALPHTHAEWESVTQALRHSGDQQSLHITDADLEIMASAVRAFFEPAMQFIQAACEKGGHVLIHCFAGAHRAGTTGVAFLMRMEKMKADDAILTAKVLRHVIDPKAHGYLYYLLIMLEYRWLGGLSSPSSERPDDEFDPRF